ncbi:MAG: DUF4157 domain-containing protein [bacterium]|nr:DUF4157 domain-containing protein [bacterium]
MNNKANFLINTQNSKKLQKKEKKGQQRSSHSSDPTVDYIMHLQRTVGNKTVEHLLASGVIQPQLIENALSDIHRKEAVTASRSIVGEKAPAIIEGQAKMTVGSANDIYEIEADRVAAQVVNMSDADVSRKTSEVEIQAKGSSAGSFTVDSGVESGIRSMKGCGSPLGESAGKYYGARFGHDFSNVRVHTGDRADSLNKAINARAFTTGNDIFFANGEYSPATRTGKMLMAHELTHVVQQKGGGKRNIVQRNFLSSFYQRLATNFDSKMGKYHMRQLSHPGGKLCDLGNCSSTVNMIMARSIGALSSYNNMKDILKKLGENKNLNVDEHLRKRTCVGWHGVNSYIGNSADPRRNPSTSIKKLSGKDVVYGSFPTQAKAFEYIIKNPGHIIKSTLSRDNAGAGRHNSNFHWIALYFNPFSKRVMVLDPLRNRKPYAISNTNPGSFHEYSIPKMSNYFGENIRVGSSKKYYMRLK